MMEWFDGNHMTVDDWVVVSLIMVFVWGVLILAAVSVWRGNAKRSRPKPDPKSGDQRL